MILSTSLRPVHVAEAEEEKEEDHRATGRKQHRREFCLCNSKIKRQDNPYADYQDHDYAATELADLVSDHPSRVSISTSVSQRGAWVSTCRGQVESSSSGEVAASARWVPRLGSPTEADLRDLSSKRLRPSLLRDLLQGLSV